MNWTRKYQPENLKEVEGQDQALQRLKQFVLDKKRKKSAVIYGPTGSGKTCVVYALANELNYEVLEVNASDIRNKEKIQTIIGSSAKQKSLFNQGKIILIDEIEGLAGRQDRGGLQALSRILEESSFPIVLTTDDPWNSKLSKIRRKSELIEFKTLNYLSIFNILKKICKKEAIKFNEMDLKTLAMRCGSDLRAAINDLQSLTEGRKELRKKDLEILGEREQRENICNALRLIFKSKKAEDVLGALNNVDLDLDGCFLWLDENLAKEYKEEDLAKAYDALSKADVFNGRIRKQQHYRFLIYRNMLMTAGVALAKKKKYKNFVEYKRSTRILKMWIAKQRYAKKRAIAGKIARITHSSTKKVLQDTLPYLQIIFKNNKEGNLTKELDLNEEELNWLKK